MESRSTLGSTPYAKEEWEGVETPAQYPLVREGLKTVLGRYGDLRVIGETGNGLEAIELAECLHPVVS